mmetsp:Transcript_21889/g.67169  ORF Transcript_21889/g.67169 Transcript_21889/m.67169 type:complete len:201 (-) Transcript_21889:2147-2749(-)
MSPSPAAKGVQLLSSLSALVSVARPPQLEPAAAAYARVLQRTDGVVGASLLPSALEGSYFLTLRRSARDVDNDERRRSSLHLLFNGDVGVTAAAPFPTPTPADVVLDSAAPSGQRRVVFRKSGDAPKAEAGIPSAQKYVADVYAGHRVVRNPSRAAPKRGRRRQAPHGWLVRRRELVALWALPNRCGGAEGCAFGFALRG